MQRFFKWAVSGCRKVETEADDLDREREMLARHTEHRIKQSFKIAESFIELRRTRVFDASEEQASLDKRPPAEEPAEPAMEEAPTKRLSVEAADQKYRDRVQALTSETYAKMKSTIEYEDLCCPICISELINPHLTNCGHVFCHDCISTYLLTSKKCPICRGQIKRKKVVPLENMAQIIEMLSVEEDKIGRVNSYQDWRDQAVIRKPILPGDLIDVRDTLYVWCVGEVKEVINSPFGRPKTLLIHYKGWNSIYDEFISADSYRIAPHGTYSSRNDLPKYLQNHREERRDLGLQLNPLLDLMQFMPR